MKIVPGDIVYTPQGKPGVVTGRDKSTGVLDVETEGPAYEKARHIGFINGVAREDRQRFNRIVEDVKSLATAKERVAGFAEAIDKLKEENPVKNASLIRYLRSQQAHLMYTEGITQRQFKVDETSLL